MPSLKVLVASTGCKLNQAEADLWKTWFLTQGYTVDEKQEADICLVTTCTVTQQADRTSVALIRRLHRKYPNAEIRITGCGATYVTDRLASLPGVTRIIGYEEKERLIAHLHYGTDGVDASVISRNRAFLRVGDGCDRRCAYCIVSRVRGSLNSKPAEKVVDELKVLSEEGFGEVVLVALNLGLWGKERGESLTDLIEQISKNGRSVPRIRLTSLEPDTITDGLLDAIAQSANICPHFHIPLQSGDDRILEEMNRPYRTEEFAALMEKIRKMLHDVCIGTDVITSTPGEHEESFTRTLEFVRAMPFSYLHVFTYSPRPGTPMFEQCRSSQHNPRERTRVLRELGKEKWFEFRKGFEDRVREGVILSPTRVLTDNYIDVKIPPASKPVRSLVNVKITRVLPEKTEGGEGGFK